MKFYTNEIYTETVELNTLDELKAYALGNNGKIYIDFCKRHEETGETLSLPVLEKVKEEKLKQ